VFSARTKMDEKSISLQHYNFKIMTPHFYKQSIILDT